MSDKVIEYLEQLKTALTEHTALVDSFMADENAPETAALTMENVLGAIIHEYPPDRAFQFVPHTIGSVLDNLMRGYTTEQGKRVYAKLRRKRLARQDAAFADKLAACGIAREHFTITDGKVTAAKGKKTEIQRVVKREKMYLDF